MAPMIDCGVLYQCQRRYSCIFSKSASVIDNRILSFASAIKTVHSMGILILEVGGGKPGSRPCRSRVQAVSLVHLSRVARDGVWCSADAPRDYPMPDVLP